MAGCCGPRDYDWFFGERFAGRVAQKYRTRGPDKTARRMADFLLQQGIDQATVLGIGGGVGEIEIELLRAGAARAHILELSSAYTNEGNKLAHEAGVGGRIDWRIHDIAKGPREIEAADVVVMHRVVCCYPGYERLLATAADHTRRTLVFSYPPRNVLSRAFYGCFNLVMRLMRSSFRGFAHPPDAMRDVLERRGLHRVYEHHGGIWEVAGDQRAS